MTRGELVTAIVVIVATVAALLWLLSALDPITSDQCIRGAHPAIVLEQCAKVQP